MKYRLAILTSHPIQYQAPLFKKIAQHRDIDLMVYFNWNFGIEKNYDKEFGREFKWDIPLLEGYNYKFLKNYSPKPSSGFWGQINFGIIKEIYNLKIKNYDAVLIFGWNSFTNWLAYLTAFILELPVFLRGENPLNQELLKPKWKISIKRIILGTLFKFVSAFLYIGDENKKFYKHYGALEEKLFFVPYAVDNERFMNFSKEQATNRESLRKELDIGAQDVVILFAGKLIEKKRPMDLLYAYQQLTTNNKQLKEKIYLLYAGDGILRGDLEKYAKENGLENAVFAGFKNQTELPQYYAMADIFVLPSGEGETWGLVVNEAMCFGLPIIVSDKVGCGKDLVKSRESGFIFPIGDVEKLSEYLKNLLENREKLKQFGKKSFEIIQNYSYKKDIESILMVLNKK